MIIVPVCHLHSAIMHIFSSYYIKSIFLPKWSYDAKKWINCVLLNMINADLYTLDILLLHSVQMGQIYWIFFPFSNSFYWYTEIYDKFTASGLWIIFYLSLQIFFHKQYCTQIQNLSYLQVQFHYDPVWIQTKNHDFNDFSYLPKKYLVKN